MEYDELNQDQHTFFAGVKYASGTFENDMWDALEDAKSIKEFKELALNKLASLEDEITEIRGRIEKCFKVIK